MDCFETTDTLHCSEGDEIGGHDFARAETIPLPDFRETISTYEGLDDELKEVEEMLQQVGEDAQRAQVDLQSALQKQQQTLQLVSNMSKSLHDTAMAIIRKIG